MRLFYCFELPAAVRAQLYEIAQPLRAIDARVSWVRPENFHITVKFLGEVEPPAAEALTALGAQIVKEFPKTEIVFDTVGAFPTTQRPRVLWIGSRQAPQAIFDLQARLEEELMKMGFEAERHFAPHVTVGRVKDEHTARVGQFAQILSQMKPFACRAPITHLTLMESTLAPGGAIYTPVATWELT
uniref:RNA 2',3'-cyclic phosphodiesterase n=2 Tax=Candidatus Bipolaricaulota TaxID=67810 RepID=H5SI62_9BACT|nr:2'-5' RNA ligase [uncultured Acetothermia bacterium]BAL58840.1 2'-5' RNA ligase [Candidatus Acetothermum autotrophicum]